MLSIGSSKNKIQNTNTAGVFLNHANTFDMVNHKILQEKLEHHGIRGIALDWCRDYLTNRKQILKYKSDNSDSLTKKCGYHRGLLRVKVSTP